MTPPLRIFALGHEASRSGAVMIHRAWLEWAGAQPERFRLRSVLVRRGPMLAEWPAGVPLVVLSRFRSERRPTWRWLANRLLDRRRALVARLRRTLAREAIGAETVALVNTLTLGWLLPVVAERGCKVVVHAHELAKATADFTTPAEIAAMRRVTSHWIAVSEAEQLHLVRNLGVAADRISVVRNFVPPRSAVLSASPTKADLGIRHGLPSDSTWVVAIGNLAPVKGPETFAGIAAAVRRRLGAGVSFVWIGDGRESPYGRGVMRHPDAGEVLWVGPSEDPRPWLLAASMLVVTSLEESCSLVALEAAQLGCPVLAFAGTGGIDESLADGAGRLVAERSSATMVAAVIQWIQNPDAARQAAEAARVRVGAEADRGRQCEAIAAVLERLGT